MSLVSCLPAAAGISALASYFNTQAMCAFDLRKIPLCFPKFVDTQIKITSPDLRYSGLHAYQLAISSYIAPVCVVIHLNIIFQMIEFRN